MALRQLLLAKQRDDLAMKLSELKSQDFTAKRADIDKRKSDVEARINALTTDDVEKRKQIEAEISEIETAYAELEQAEAARDEMVEQTERAIASYDAEINELNAKSKGVQERKERTNTKMTNKFFSTREQADAFFSREDVNTFLTEFRTKLRSMSGGNLAIPEVFLEVLRENIESYSKLVSKVRYRSVTGTARMNITGAVPEGVWTEATAALNELDFSLTQITVDGYMVGGYIAMPNSILDDSSQPALGSLILEQLGESIGKAIDAAIIYGSGQNMPIGIVTRLAAETQPSWWGANQASFTDLHTSNIMTLDLSAKRGAEFFESLAENLAMANPKYSATAPVWIMNRKTHLDIKAKALSFGVESLVSAGQNTFPVVGGEIIELELIPDKTIVGGYLDNYLLVEREGANIAQSKEYRFLENQTVFKAQARYDGKPIYGEAFVLISYNNSQPATTRTFPKDWANEQLGQLSVTAAASASSTGKTILTVTGMEASGTTLKYKKGVYTLRAGNKLGTGWTVLESGITEITAAAGTTITVAEVDADGHVLKVDAVEAVPKA